MSAMHSAPSIFLLCPSIIFDFLPQPSPSVCPFGWAHWDFRAGVSSRSETAYDPGGRERDVVRAIAAYAAVASLLASPAAYAQSVEEFYKSHPVTMMVGFNVGNIYD